MYFASSGMGYALNRLGIDVTAAKPAVSKRILETFLARIASGGLVEPIKRMEKL